jgi:Tol biopolymer transport system component
LQASSRAAVAVDLRLATASCLSGKRSPGHPGPGGADRRRDDIWPDRLIDSSGHRIATLSKRVGSGVSNWAPAWSPDGQWLAFARSTDGRRSFHVFVMRADGSGLRQITHGRFDESPSWSPDGRWIAYVSTGGIRIVHPNGRGSRFVRGTGLTRPHYTEIYGTLPSWTPQGRLSYSFHPEIAGDRPTSCRTARAHCGWVFVSDRDGRHRRAVLRGRDAHWSSDGKTIVFTPPNGGVAVFSGGHRRLLGHGYKANWSPDGIHIIYARLGTTAAGDAIWIMDAVGQHSHRIMQGASDPAWRPPAG